MILDETRPPNLNDPDWPATCVNTPADYRPLGYLEWHAMAAERTRRGEGQVLCQTCQRYRWTSTPCNGTKAE